MIPAWLLPALGSRAGQIAIAALVAGAVGFGAGYDMADDAAEVDRLEVALEAMERSADLERAARVTAEDRLKEAEAETASLAAIARRARSAPHADDAPLAPVLDRALRELDGLRQP